MNKLYSLKEIRMSDTILIADDNPDNLAVLSGLLRGAGYTVRPAADGAMALEALQHMQVDLILLDIVMPEMDGYQVCAALKKNPTTRDIPVIFISALQEPLDKVKAFGMGGVDYVSKPFDHEEVLARVSTHLQLYRLQALKQRYAEELEAEVARKTAALREANIGMEKALQAKDGFLSLMSHELRTPLNCILGMVEILRNCSAQERQELLDILEQSGLRLLRLLENLLQLTALGYVPAGTEEQADAIDIERLCTESLRIVANSAEEKNLSLHLDIDTPARLEMPLDAARIRQVLVNLLDNAVKFTPSSGAIGLGLHYDKGGEVLYCKVWDTGPGIPASERDKIFEPFVQLEPLMTRSNEGAGLGLALTHNLLRLHQGSIEVAENEDGGSIFRVSVSASKADTERTVVCRITSSWFDSFTAPPEEAAEEQKLSAEQARQLSKLVMPFDLNGILQFAAQLEQTGCCPRLAKRIAHQAKAFRMDDLWNLAQSKNQAPLLEE